MPVCVLVCVHVCVWGGRIVMHVYTYLVRSSQGQRYKPPLTLPI